MRPGATDVVVNGDSRRIDQDSDSLLIHMLRNDWGLTGTKLGCGTGDCGSCTVLVEGQPVNSCLVYTVECQGLQVETIEGVSATQVGRVLVDEFVKADAVQCGYCTPGLVVTATALLRGAWPEIPSDDRISWALAGNLCRCTGYLPIVHAVRCAAQYLSSVESL
jgi:carbon-monoxide dehydrogenase small subunit